MTPPLLSTIQATNFNTFTGVFPDLILRPIKHDEKGLILSWVTEPFVWLASEGTKGDSFSSKKVYQKRILYLLAYIYWNNPEKWLGYDDLVPVLKKAGLPKIKESTYGKYVTNDLDTEFQNRLGVGLAHTTFDKRAYGQKGYKLTTGSVSVKKWSDPNTSQKTIDVLPQNLTPQIRQQEWHLANNCQELEERLLTLEEQICRRGPQDDLINSFFQIRKELWSLQASLGGKTLPAKLGNVLRLYEDIRFLLFPRHHPVQSANSDSEELVNLGVKSMASHNFLEAKAFFEQSLNLKEEPLTRFLLSRSLYALCEFKYSLNQLEGALDSLSMYNPITLVLAQLLLHGNYYEEMEITMKKRIMTRQE